jgi:glycosyltransferase involved in cell wall biosynthesis
MKQLVEVFIATYNRPNFISDTINSIVNQSYENLKIVISDNSSDSRTHDLILSLKLPNNVSYIKRSPSLPAIDHLNKILDEVSASFFVIFHDDDLMESDMIDEQMKVMSKFPNAVCVGVNSFVLLKEKMRKKLFLDNLDSVFQSISKTDFINRYLSKNMIVPFCGYLYRTNLVSEMRMNFDRGGKYCDVSFLLSLFNNGDIFFINKPLMTLRVHEGQDSRSHSYSDYGKMIDNLRLEGNLDKNNYSIRRARVYNIYGFMSYLISKNEFQIIKRREIKLIKILLFNSSFDLVIKILYKYFFKRHK